MHRRGERRRFVRVADEMIDIQNIEGRVRASSVKKISEIVERHPTETANIIRGWMIEQT